jgi:hypothetical protein
MQGVARIEYHSEFDNRKRINRRTYRDIASSEHIVSIAEKYIGRVLTDGTDAIMIGCYTAVHGTRRVSESKSWTVALFPRYEEVGYDWEGCNWNVPPGVKYERFDLVRHFYAAWPHLTETGDFIRQSNGVLLLNRNPFTSPIAKRWRNLFPTMALARDSTSHSTRLLEFRLQT